MKCPPLEIPDRLASSLETGDLAIFAGAGVSMGPPTNLPSFNGLAEEIAKRFGIKEIPEKHLDQFLATVKGKGHDIHDACRSIIGGKSPPNEIHELILRLFKRPEDVRIVTSNFDTCFSVAAPTIRPGVQVFAGPALPQGTDFRGIVHLHGSVTDPESRRMVLTSEDFGQAYLTKGWALRFLLDLYSRYTVLFIGYSHSDPILDYLAFGLRNASGNRYAIHHGPAEQWSRLGIELIPYELSAAPNRYINLRNGLRSWVAEVERTPLELEKRLDKVLHASSEPSPEDEDFLDRSMRETSSALKFVRYAQDTGLRWIHWLNSKGKLKEQLNLDSSGDKGAVAVAQWIGRNLVQASDWAGLGLVESHGGSIGSIVWDMIARELTRDDSKLIATPHGQRWLGLILTEQAAKGNDYSRCRLLQKTINEELWPSALLLFDILAEPSVKLVPGFPTGPAPEIDIEIVLRGDVQQLLLVWRESISRVLPEIAGSLAPILEAKIESAHRLAIHDGSANRVRARVLFARHHIEAADEPVYGRGVDVLLFFFAAILQALNRQRKGATADWVDRLLKSDNPILVRFGLYALRECISLTSSQKLSWLIDRSLFYPEAYGGTSEVFELLKAIYGDLTPAERDQLWQELDKTLPPSDRDDPEAEMQREQIDRLGWHLAKANPEDPSAIAARERIGARNPRLKENDSWLPGEFSRSVSGPVGDKSPITVPELLSAPPIIHVDQILDFKGTHWPEPTREGLLAAVAAASRENKEWGAGLMREMAKKEAWSSDVWIQLFWAVRLADLPTEAQKWFLNVAAPELTKVENSLNALARFCFQGQTIEELRSLSPSDLEARLAFSLTLWEACRKVGYVGDEDSLETDWVDLSINRAPGSIVEFWLMNQQLQVERADDENSQWPVILGGALDEIISGECDADLLGLSLVAMHLAFVRHSSPKWTQENLYPAFDFGQNPNRAWVAWSSLILHGSWDRDAVIDLKPMIQASCGRLAGGPDRLARQFVLLSSTITASGLFDVNSDGWLTQLIRTLNPKQRALWTRNLARQFKKIPSESRHKAWEEWVRAYWRNRLAGSPDSIGTEESEELIGLAEAFEEDFSEAVSLLIRGPRPSLKHFLPYEFADSKLPERYPEAYLDALNWVLSSMSDYVVLPSALENLLHRLPRRSSLLPQWIAYCQNLSRLNVEGAVKIEAEGREWFTQPE